MLEGKSKAVRAQGYSDRTSEQVHALTVKFINPLDILPGLVLDAIDRRNPAYELLKVQRKKWFAYPVAQQHLLDTLWKVERDEFLVLLETGVFSERLQSCMAHRGELFKKFQRMSSSGDACADESLRKQSVQSRDVLQHQRVAWISLMTEQLRYLEEQSDWTPECRAMAYHACSIMNAFRCSEDVPVMSTTFGYSEGPLVHALTGIIQGPGLLQLLRGESPLEDMRTLKELVILAVSLTDRVLSEEVVSLLPALFEMARTLVPEEFTHDDWDDSDAWDEDDLEEDWAEDSYGEESLDDSTWELADDSFTSSLSDSNREWLEEEDDNGAEGWSSRWNHRTSEEENVLMDELVPLLGLGLRELRRLADSEHHVEHVKDILLSSPMGMILWQEAVDTLISISPDAFKDFLPVLLEMSLEDENGPLCIIGIADYAFRHNLSPEEGPLRLLAKALRDLDKEDRGELLRGAKDWIANGPEVFLDLDAAKAGLRLLHQELKKPNTRKRGRS